MCGTDPVPYTKHLWVKGSVEATSAGPIHVDGDTATGTWYQQEFLHGKDGGQRSVTGRYQDDYIKQDGRWYFKRRVYEVLNSETKD